MSNEPVEVPSMYQQDMTICGSHPVREKASKHKILAKSHLRVFYYSFYTTQITQFLSKYCKKQLTVRPKFPSRISTQVWILDRVLFPAAGLARLNTKARFPSIDICLALAFATTA
jgi:hypothetical protein